MIEEQKKKNKELCERYPYLVARNVWTDEPPEDCDYSYIRGIGELPDGWHKLFLQMCEDIRQPLIDANCIDKFIFSQIKEKYNQACFYYFEAPEEVHHILRKYEYISQFVCQGCGAPATVEVQGWITSYCDNCFQKLSFHKNANTIPIKFIPALKINDFKNGERYHEIIDCSDIWNRLYSK